MRKSRFSEEQIIGMIREYDAGVKTTEICRRYGISDATFQRYKARRRDKLLEGVRSAPGKVADEAYSDRRRGRALDPNERARQKQAARDADARKLANGEVSPAELARENGFFSECDLAGSDIVLPSGKILPGRR